MTKKEIGLGVSDFKEVILENKYYVDKTGLIKEVIDDGSKVLLITRPRRFGKKINHYIVGRWSCFGWRCAGVSWNQGH